jgi:DNA replication protein DnaC
MKSLFLNVPDWLNAVREAWDGDDADQPPNPNGYELVVVDDLGAENATAWSRERIYSLINHRCQNGLYTLVTTNLAPGEIRAKLGRATASRIAMLCANVPFEPRHDYRELLAQATEGR